MTDLRIILFLLLLFFTLRERKENFSPTTIYGIQERPMYVNELFGPNFVRGDNYGAIEIYRMFDGFYTEDEDEEEEEEEEEEESDESEE